MVRTAAILSALLLAIGFSAASTDANADVPSPVKRAPIETAHAKAFVIKGHRVLVPSDENAEEIIKALKERYPDLKPDATAKRVN